MKQTRIEIPTDIIKEILNKLGNFGDRLNLCKTNKLHYELFRGQSISKNIWDYRRISKYFDKSLSQVSNGSENIRTLINIDELWALRHFPNIRLILVSQQISSLQINKFIKLIRYRKDLSDKSTDCFEIMKFHPEPNNKKIFPDIFLVSGKIKKCKKIVHMTIDMRKLINGGNWVFQLDLPWKKETSIANILYCDFLCVNPFSEIAKLCGLDNTIIKNGAISKGRIEDYKILTGDRGTKLFHKIKQIVVDNEFPHTITHCNPYERLIVYLICEMFSIKYEVKKVNVKVKIPCSDFYPPNKGLPRYKHQEICGCDWAPHDFWDKHYDNNYEDTISYSLYWRTTKEITLLSSNF